MVNKAPVAAQIGFRSGQSLALIRIGYNENLKDISFEYLLNTFIILKENNIHCNNIFLKLKEASFWHKKMMVR